MNSELREVTRLRFDVSVQKASHIKLVKGVVRVNPHVRVLCPTLAKGQICRKGKQKKNGIPYRPKLLVKNHGSPGLQLWSCEGCKDKFLLRANLNEAFLSKIF